MLRGPGGIDALMAYCTSVPFCDLSVTSNTMLAPSLKGLNLHPHLITRGALFIASCKSMARSLLGAPASIK